jgi:hypothetical protein
MQAAQASPHGTASVPGSGSGRLLPVILGVTGGLVAVVAAVAVDFALGLAAEGEAVSVDVTTIVWLIAGLLAFVAAGAMAVRLKIGGVLLLGSAVLGLVGAALGRGDPLSLLIAWLVPGALCGTGAAVALVRSRRPGRPVARQPSRRRDLAPVFAAAGGMVTVVLAGWLWFWGSAAQGALSGDDPTVVNLTARLSHYLFLSALLAFGSAVAERRSPLVGGSLAAASFVVGLFGLVARLDRLPYGVVTWVAYALWAPAAALALAAAIYSFARWRGERRGEMATRNPEGPDPQFPFGSTSPTS